MPVFSLRKAASLTKEAAIPQLAATVAPPPPVVWQEGSGDGWWVLKDGPAWKNDILIRYQKGLYAGGITNRDHLRQYAQQMMQESGVNILPVGDSGCSFGILQMYVCYGKIRSIHSFFANGKNAEWKTLDYQLAYWINAQVALYKLYDGDIRRAIVRHNNPNAAINKKEWRACDGIDSYRYINGRGYSCYYQDEVNDPDVVAQFALSSSISLP